MTQAFLGSEKKDLYLVLGMIGILIVLFTPIPAGLLDFLLVANLSFGLLILLLAFYAEKPLSFSTFPSLLLIATLFRLSLNIAATRLVLSDAHAGEVIASVGAYVVGGNYVIGMVVFLILVVVQYVVVTNGAQRVAEVAARFTLDSMPGKQMSIDADMNMGLIDEKEAKERRALVEKEANFYGAMDGATKFVKGDAIAGIVIILIDIIGGLSIGIVQHGMDWSEALQTFTLLTVGDGIVTQIPSLVIAVATGILITRAATDTHLGSELAGQITSQPKTLVIVTLTLFLALFLPGFPTLPIFLLAVVFALLTYSSYKKQPDEEVEVLSDEAEQDDELMDVMNLYPLEITMAGDVAHYLEDAKVFLKQQFSDIRAKNARELGVILPEIKLTEDKGLEAGHYCVLIEGLVYGKGRLVSDKVLAISSQATKVKLQGESVKEPAFNLPATWIEQNLAQEAKQLGYTTVEPRALLMTHFKEIVRKHAAELLTRGETEKLVERVRGDNVGLIEELIPNQLSYSDIQQVLKELLSEGVSIRRMGLILEALADAAKISKEKRVLVEGVRRALGGQIVQQLKEQNEALNVVVFEPELEQKLLQGLSEVNGKMNLIVAPEMMKEFIKAVCASLEAMLGQQMKPVIICASPLRKPLKQFVDRLMPEIHILSMNEPPNSAKLNVFKTVKV